MEEGISFSLLVCPQGGTYPGQIQTYPLDRSGWGRGYLKVPTPPVRSGWGYPKVPTHWPGQDGGGVPQGTYLPPPARSEQGRGGTPRYLPPARSGWGEGYAKVPNPQPGQYGGTPSYLPTCQVRMGGGVPQGTYPPGQVRMGEGIPQGTYPPRHPPTLPAKDLLHGGRYASCV